MSLLRTACIPGNSRQFQSWSVSGRPLLVLMYHSAMRTIIHGWSLATPAAVLTAVLMSAAVLAPVAAHAQQGRWGAANDKTVQYITQMEAKWAEGVCVNNGVIAALLAEDFQGTSTSGARFTKVDELRDEKGPHSRVIAASMRPGCTSSERILRSSTDANMPWARTRASRRRETARSGPIHG